MRRLHLIITVLGALAWTPSELPAAEEARYFFYDSSRPGRHKEDSVIIAQKNTNSKMRTNVYLYTVLEYPGQANQPHPAISVTVNNKEVPAEKVLLQWPPNNEKGGWVKIKPVIPRDAFKYWERGARNSIKVKALFADGTEIERELNVTGVFLPELEWLRIDGEIPLENGYKQSFVYKIPPSPINMVRKVPPDDAEYGLRFQMNGKLDLSPFKQTYSSTTTGGASVVINSKEIAVEVGTKDTSNWNKDKGQWDKVESKASLGLSYTFTLWEKSFDTILPQPAVKVIEGVPFIGPKIKGALKEFKASLEADTSLYGDANLGLTAQDDFIKNIDFGGEVDLKLSLSATIEFQAVGKLGLKGMAGGKIALELSTPPFIMSSLSGEIYLAAELYFFCFETKGYWTIASFTIQNDPKGALPPTPPNVEESPFQLVPPPPANEPLEYAMSPLRKPAPRATASSQATATSLFRRLGVERNITRNSLMRASRESKRQVEASAVIPLVYNPTAVAWPTVASQISSGGLLSIFGVDTRPAGSTEKTSQFSKLRWTYYINGQWTEPAPMPVGNGAAQISPIIKPLSEHRPDYIAAWQQLEDPNFKGTQVTDWMNQTQLVVGIFQGEDGKGNKINKWTTQEFGSPGRADISPRIAGIMASHVENNRFTTSSDTMVLWTSATIDSIQKSEGKGMPDDAEFRFALYRDGKWETPDYDREAKRIFVPKGLLSMDFVGGGYYGYLVYSEDIGGGKSRLMCRKYDVGPKANNDGWNEPRQISQVEGINVNPKASMVRPNLVLVVWTENGDLVASTYKFNDLSTHRKVTLRKAADGTAPPDVKITELYQEGAEASRDIAISWSEQTPNGPSIVSAVFDHRTNQWGRPMEITPGQDLETLFATATDKVGNLIPLYLHTEVAYGTVQAPNEDGRMVSVANAPIMGSEKLMIGRFRPTRDLTFAEDGLTTSSENFAGGSTVKLTARVKSEGMLGFLPVSVSFYHGNPKKGGKLIATGKSATPLPGGCTVDVNVDWKLSEDVWDKNTNLEDAVYAVVEKPELVTEWNPDNNMTVLYLDEIALSATAKSEDAREDGSATVEVKIQNKGFPFTAPFPVMIYDYSGNRLITTETVPKVDAGGFTRMNLELPKDTVRGANGADFLIKIDPDNTLKQANNRKVPNLKLHIPSASH